jgi:large subunit ribosomal protein L30
MADKLKVTLVRSTVGTNPSARGTVRALGLRHIGQSSEFEDGPAVRGQIRAVRYLLEVEEVAAPAKKKRATTTKKSTAAAKKEEAEA